MLFRSGAEEEAAMNFALEVGDFLIRTWGGNQVYIPSGHLFACSARNKTIFDEFDGNNCKELAAKYGLTERHIYRIVQMERAARGFRSKSGEDEASGD